MLPPGGYYTELYNLDSEFQSEDSNSSFSRSFLSGNTYPNNGRKSSLDEANPTATPGGPYNIPNEYYSCTVITPTMMMTKPQLEDEYTETFYTAEHITAVENRDSLATDLLCGEINGEDAVASYPEQEIKIEESYWTVNRKYYRAMKFVAGFLQVLSLIIQWRSLIRELVIQSHPKTSLMSDRIETILFAASMILLIGCKAAEYEEFRQIVGESSSLTLGFKHLGRSLDWWIIIVTIVYLVNTIYQEVIQPDNSLVHGSLIASAAFTLFKSVLSCSYLLNSFFHGEDERLVEAAVEATLSKLTQKNALSPPKQDQTTYS